MRDGSGAVVQVLAFCRRFGHKIRLAYCCSRFWVWTHWRRRIISFETTPVDFWGGSATQGQAILNGFFFVRDAHHRLYQYTWSSLDSLFAAKDAYFLPYLYSFSWLRDLKATGEMAARRLARRIIEHWIDARLWRRKDVRRASQTQSVAGQRLANWIWLYNFFGASARDNFRYMFFRGLQEEYRALKRECTHKAAVPEQAARLKACLAYNAFVEADWLFVGVLLEDLRLFVRALEIWIGAGRVGPAGLFHLFADLLEIRNALSQLEKLAQASLSAPPSALLGAFAEVQQMLKQMVHWVRFYRHSNGELCRMPPRAAEGGLRENTNASNIDIALSQVESSAMRKEIEALGLARAAAKRSVLFMNARSFPQTPLRLQGYAPSSTPNVLAVEWSNDAQLVIQSSRVALFDRESRQPFFARRPSSVDGAAEPIGIKKEETAEGTLLSASSEDAVGAHRREAFLSSAEKLLAITDTITVSAAAEAPVALFHFTLGDGLILQTLHYEKGANHGEAIFAMETDGVTKRRLRKSCALQIVATEPIYVEVKSVRGAAVVTVLCMPQPEAPLCVNWSFQVQKK